MSHPFLKSSLEITGAKKQWRSQHGGKRSRVPSPHSEKLTKNQEKEGENWEKEAKNWGKEGQSREKEEKPERKGKNREAFFHFAPPYR